MLICVLNLGLKSMRAAVFDEDGRRLSIAYRPIESRMGEGIVEQSPDTWWSAAVEVLAEVMADRSVARCVRLVTVTASAGCLVAMDADGNVVRNAIMISDVRARDHARRLESLLAMRRSAPIVTRVTPDLMLPKISWLKDAEPDIFRRTRWFASPNDFLVNRLTGQLVTDPDNASKYFFDPDTWTYPSEILDELGVDEGTLPPVGPDRGAALEIRPSLLEKFGLQPSARVVLSTYDAICAVYGSGVAGIGEACDVSGTVTSFRVVTDRATKDPAGRLFITPHVARGLFLAGGSNNLGGGVVEWAKQTLYPQDTDPYDQMTVEANDAPPGAAGLIFLPYLLGERAPIWDPNARGVFFGLGRSHARGDLIRAVFEGVAYSVLDIANRLVEMGIEISQVSASGGMARLEPINQIKADMLGVPVTLTEELETTALGAALLAGVHSGNWPSLDHAAAACIRYSTTLEPDAARTRMYRDFFGIYRGLYERLRDMFDERERLIGEHRDVLRTVLARSENL